MKQNNLYIELSDKVFELKLFQLQKRIGVLVSGGMDSAILYYLLLLYNKLNNSYYTIKPYTIAGPDNIYAENVIRYVHSQFDLPYNGTNYLYNIKENNISVVPEAINLVLQNESVVYCGHIYVLPEHSINVPYSQNWIDSFRVKYPLKHLDKGNIVELIVLHKVPKLFDLTKSCVYDVVCGKCNRCLERSYAFNKTGYIEFDNK